MTDRNVDIRRTFNVPLAKLYALCTSPAFFRRVDASLNQGYMDFREGGRYDYPFPEGKGRVWGEYRQIVPHERVVLTWSTDHPSGGPIEDSVITMTFREVEGGSELHLVHEGFPTDRSFESHDEGWNEIFESLASDFNSALGQALRSGLSLKFKLPQRFACRVEKVFEAFVDEENITKFFVLSTTGPLEPGQQVHWRFRGFDGSYSVYCQDVVPNELIRFVWGSTNVRFDFEDLGEQSRLTISCAGFEPSNEGLKDSYSECEGWRHVMLALKVLLEHGINIDEPAYTYE